MGSVQDISLTIAKLSLGSGIADGLKYTDKSENKSIQKQADTGSLFGDIPGLVNSLVNSDPSIFTAAPGSKLSETAANSDTAAPDKAKTGTEDLLGNQQNQKPLDQNSMLGALGLILQLIGQLLQQFAGGEQTAGEQDPNKKQTQGLAGLKA